MAEGHLTDALRERVLDLTRTGHPVKRISAVTGLCYGAVYTTIREAGLQPFSSRRRLTDEEAAEAVRLAKEGMSSADLMRKYSISRNGINSLLAKAAVTRTCPRCLKVPVERKRRFCNDCSLGDNIKRARAWRKRRLDAGICVCGQSIADDHSNCESCRERRRQRDAEIKRDIIAGYGGKCACCGETEPAFLTIDHVENDGRHQRLHGGHGSSYTLYRKLIREGFPDFCALLCFNCNHGRFICGGICPHKK